VAFHCVMPEGSSLTGAHELTELLEQALREWMPRLGRVVIHVEPPGVDDHDGH
jgi:divalent metal cation (Fe/Co/Zn/Cd) transporter